MVTRVIREAHGNLLAADVDALVNTVNTVGVMGKGIALQFKRAYPEMFREYARAARAGELSTGRMQVWETDAATGPRFVINFPTKRHWRSPSSLEYVTSGLDDLARVIAHRGIRSIAVPPLGCGQGGLQWSTVRPLIEASLGGLDSVIWLYPPEGAPAARDMVERRPKPPLNLALASLLAMMHDYRAVTLEAPSVIEVQKLMYFLQEAGQDLKLTFERGRYGPYSDRLRQVLVEMEGHYLLGFGDGSARVSDAEPLQLIDDGGDEAAVILGDHLELSSRMARVLELAQGFETPYGLELLASTHWVSTHHEGAAEDPQLAIRVVREWTPRKKHLFQDAHVRDAWQRLHETGWLKAPATISRPRH